ncbi:MAG: hypothetical protein CM15mP112_07790 [Flavobacteriales bacterium]|nr:MAG: hypothetical protein CM15mP112_07790 [Flavobacteriales bacterium]
MNERLRKWMSNESLKPSKLAENIKVNRATISHILSGRNKPSIEFLQKLLNNYSDLNANWLITGVGFMKKIKILKNLLITRKLIKLLFFLMIILLMN